MDWLQLPVHTAGAVMYGYSTIAGLAGANTSALGTVGFPASLSTGSGALAVTGPTATALTADWYAVTAVGNPSNDTDPCVVMGTSFTNDLVVANEGN
jgi:hypothetical protein